MRSLIGNLRASNGFTIIETLVALSLLLVTIVPLAVLLQVGLKTSVKTSTRMHAREIAASEIDMAKSMAFDAIGINTATETFDPAENGQQVKQENGYSGFAQNGTAESSGVTYTVTRDVIKVVNESRAVDSSTKEVIITVSWTAPEPAGFIQLTTFVGPTEMTES